MFNHLCHCTENIYNSQEKQLSIIIFHMNLTHLTAQGAQKQRKEFIIIKLHKTRGRLGTYIQVYLILPKRTFQNKGT